MSGKIIHKQCKTIRLFVDGVSFFRMPRLFEVGVGLKLFRDNPSDSPDGALKVVDSENQDLDGRRGVM